MISPKIPAYLCVCARARGPVGAGDYKTRSGPVHPALPSTPAAKGKQKGVKRRQAGRQAGRQGVCVRVCVRVRACVWWWRGFVTAYSVAP